MVELLQKNPEIYRIDIPLSGNALKNLNCYVIKSKGQSVVIDTGFNHLECKEALDEGLQELGIDTDHTNLLITHLHTDHMGLAPGFSRGDSKIYMGQTEISLMGRWKNHGFRREMDQMFLQEGVSKDILEEAAKKNPILVYAPDEEFDAIPVKDGDQLIFGDLVFTVLEMPGHSPGHICYYLENEKIMFLGDHILFDITPNITVWPDIKDSLSNYLYSLHRTLTFDIQTAYPSHRGLCYKILEQRVDEITRHHSKRLEEIMEVIQANPGCSGYDIASKLTWSLHGENWETAPKRQIWFALGETLAHIEYLISINKIYRGKKRVNQMPVHTYFLV